jgi:hypothetical protein
MTDDKLTGEMIKSALKQLPKEMDSQQISAFLLTVLDGYVGSKVSEAMSILITSTIVYGRARGISDNRIATLMVASGHAIVDYEPTQNNKVH